MGAGGQGYSKVRSLSLGRRSRHGTPGRQLDGFQPAAANGGGVTSSRRHRTRPRAGPRPAPPPAASSCKGRAPGLEKEGPRPEGGWPGATEPRRRAQAAARVRAPPRPPFHFAPSPRCRGAREAGGAGLLLGAWLPRWPGWVSAAEAERAGRLGRRRLERARRVGPRAGWVAWGPSYSRGGCRDF